MYKVRKSRGVGLLYVEPLGLGKNVTGGAGPRKPTPKPAPKPAPKTPSKPTGVATGTPQVYHPTTPVRAVQTGSVQLVGSRFYKPTAAAPKPTTTTLTPLQVAENLLSTDPSALTLAQWELLQQNGLIPSTLPYGSQIQPTQTASSQNAVTSPAPGSMCYTGTNGLPTTGNAQLDAMIAAGQASSGDPTCDQEIQNAYSAGTSSALSTSLTSEYYGVPLWGWLTGAAVTLMIFMGKKKGKKR